MRRDIGRLMHEKPKWDQSARVMILTHIMLAQFGPITIPTSPFSLLLHVTLL